MTVAEIQQKLEALNSDDAIQNIIAQANARSILLSTQEDTRNFPPYTINDERLEILALQYLNLGCQLAEQGELEGARHPLEVGATILENIHGTTSDLRSERVYYTIIASLAYYVSFQYSKAFILIGKIEPTTIIGRLVSLFLKRDFFVLRNAIFELTQDQSYLDETLAALFLEDDSTSDTKIYEITIAKALNKIILYLVNGNNANIQEAKDSLLALKEIAEIKGDPGIWWVIRLLLLISDGIEESSLWNVLSRHFDLDDAQILAYINALIYLPPRGVHELFITQRKSLQMVLNSDQKGAVISIPTSSGKTRIAELAILDCINRDQDAKVLYIAPFRSLAFEVETSLSKVLRRSRINVSHLYGGSLYSRLDDEMLDDANVIIVTPEKAKAILRGNDEIFSQIKLVIVDEGHLLGESKRLIANEVYYEEIRHFVETNAGRFLLLSAVLPNAEELAIWLTGQDDKVFKDVWRPSDERFGILDWNGSRVNLEWKNNDAERNSFNNSFIIQTVTPAVPPKRKDKIFPESKWDAVAATAYKLRTFGPALIFVGRKASVFPVARSYSECLENHNDFEWPIANDWKAYELACKEVYGDENNWLTFAKRGILCHNANLHADVRLPLERLMRSSKARVIICTSTLGQGVNLGVSTVIFGSLDQGGSPLSVRDFWNIAGRAGRAFVDNEGKILVTLESIGNPYRIPHLRREINEYLDRDNMDLAQSGLLSSITTLISIARSNGLDLDHFLQLVSENSINDLGDEAQRIEAKLNWIDDTILSLHSIFNTENENQNYDWVDQHFRHSLAYIQARAAPQTAENVIRFVRARAQGIVAKVGNNRQFWASVVKSGIPLTSDLQIEVLIPDIIILIEGFIESPQSIREVVVLSQSLEHMLSTLPVITDESAKVISEEIDQIRVLWFNGIAMNQIINLHNAENVITTLYAFVLPWLYNGIAKKLKLIDREDCATVVETLAITCESGLPRLECVKIYQAGVRSRIAAVEIGLLYESSAMTVRDYRRELVQLSEEVRAQLSEHSLHWLDLLFASEKGDELSVTRVVNFTADIQSNHGDILLVKRIKDKLFLTSPNFEVAHDISGSVIDFSEVCDVPGIFFRFNQRRGEWQMKIDNPYIRII